MGNIILFLIVLLFFYIFRNVKKITQLFDISSIL